MIQKASRMSLAEQVAAQMENLIEQEHWKTGEKIPPEKELMEKFDVSRNTLREAIRALVHAGLLETKQGSGTIVHNKSALGAALERHVKKATMLETLEVRLALEKQAAQLAAERRTNKDLEKMKASLESCQQASLDGDTEKFISSDIEFHQAVVQSSRNQLLIDLYGHMTDALNAFVQEMLALEFPLSFEEELHRGLLEAIQNQDFAAAAGYVEKDMEALQNSVMKMMEE